MIGIFSLSHIASRVRVVCEVAEVLLADSFSLLVGNVENLGGVPILIDAILTLPPGREFTKTVFVDHAGVTRETVSRYIKLLLETEVVEEIPNSSPRRYRVAKSDVVQELFELNSALNTGVK